MISQANVLAFLVAAFPDPENRRARMSLAGLRRKGFVRVAAAKRKAAL